MRLSLTIQAAQGWANDDDGARGRILKPQAYLLPLFNRRSIAPSIGLARDYGEPSRPASGLTKGSNRRPFVEG